MFRALGLIPTTKAQWHSHAVYLQNIWGCYWEPSQDLELLLCTHSTPALSPRWLGEAKPAFSTRPDPCCFQILKPSVPSLWSVPNKTWILERNLFPKYFSVWGTTSETFIGRILGDKDSCRFESWLCHFLVMWLALEFPSPHLQDRDNTTS